MTDHRATQANRYVAMIEAGVDPATARRSVGLDPLYAASIEDCGVSDFELAVRALSKDPDYANHSETDLMRGLGSTGLAGVRDQIEAERSLVLAGLQKSADTAHAASPAGRAAAAQAVSDQRIKLAADARLARLLLVDEGLSEADASGLSDADALTYSGMVQTEQGFFDGVDSMAANRTAAGLDTPEGGTA